MDAVELSDARGKVRLAGASRDEARSLLEWENVSRRFSFKQGLIGWEEHWRWYQTMRSSGHDLLLMTEDRFGRLNGSISFKSEDGRVAYVGVIVRPDSRRQGWGRWAIRAGCEFAFLHRGYQRIMARIRAENLASKKAFLAAGFHAAAGPGTAVEDVELLRPKPSLRTRST